MKLTHESLPHSICLTQILLVFTLFLLSPQVLSQSVFCHYMMGNSYNSDQGSFTNDITLASRAGIDGFALNIGNDDWMSDRISKMFDAATGFSNFTLFFSFDMSVITDATTLINYVVEYHTHPNSFFYQGKYFVSTFAGETQTFGQDNVNDGWQTQFKDPLSAQGIDIYFMPSWTALGPNQIFENNPVMDGMFSWGAWPTTDADLGLDLDNAFMADAHANGKQYMAGVSPWFFTHFDYKNWIYKSEHLWPQRWQDMLTLKPDLIEIISWNDFGESHYIGPVEGAMPAGSEAWVTGFDHQPWLEMASYFITAYKTGQPPSIDKDQVFFWYRTSSKDAVMSDPLPLPNNSDWADDNIVAYSFLTAPAEILITTGGQQTSFDAVQGTQLIETPFQEGPVIVTISRDGQQLASQQGGIDVSNSGSLYNFNAWVGKVEVGS